MPSAPRAPSDPSPKLCKSCSACNAAFPRQDQLMTTSPILMSSVETLRAALKLSSRAGLSETMQLEIPKLWRWDRFNSDFIALAHRHQEPPLQANGGGPWTIWLML